jgi:hypothetical protein
MFDRCRVWRSLLTRRAEGALSPGQRAVLDDHILKCARCRATRDADDALHAFGAAPGASLPLEHESPFDDSVIRDLRVAGAADELPAGWRGRVQACARSLSFEFCMQLAGGGLAAACVTAFLVVSALNPVSNEGRLSAYELRSISAIGRNEPPVPLESLFQSPSPRAAMLWAAPGRSLRPVATEPQSSAAEPKNDAGHKRAPRRHGRAWSGRYIG